MSLVSYAVFSLLPILACLVVASVVKNRRLAQTDDPAMEALIRDGRLNYSYSKHAPFGTYDYEKASASSKRSQAHAKKHAQTVAANQRKEKAKSVAKVAQIKRRLTG